MPENPYQPPKEVNEPGKSGGRVRNGRGMDLNPGGFAGAFLGSVMGAAVAIFLVPYDPAANSAFSQRFAWLLIGGLIAGAVVCNRLWTLLQPPEKAMSDNPYEPPQQVIQRIDPDKPPQVKMAPINIALPWWVWRVLMGAIGIIIVADVFTRSRPDLRPALLGVVAAVVETLIAFWCLILSVSRLQVPTHVAVRPPDTLP